MLIEGNRFLSERGLFVLLFRNLQCEIYISLKNKKKISKVRSYKMKTLIFVEMEKQVILNKRHFELTLNRLCYQLIESHSDFSNTVLIGLQPRGVNVVARLKSQLERNRMRKFGYYFLPR